MRSWIHTASSSWLANQHAHGSKGGKANIKRTKGHKSVKMKPKGRQGIQIEPTGNQIGRKCCQNDLSMFPMPQRRLKPLLEAVNPLFHIKNSKAVNTHPACNRKLPTTPCLQSKAARTQPACSRKLSQTVLHAIERCSQNLARC